MTERELPTSAFITLGLLASREWSAYQLAEQVGRGVDQLWPRADRQRYNILKRLLDGGLVTSRDENSGRRSRTIYAITDAGRAELARWIGTAARPPAMEFEGMLRVLVAEQGEIDDLRRTIGDIREQAQQAQALFAQHAAYISATGGTFPERRHLFGLANTFMIGHYQHMADWAEWALAQTAEWPDAASPASDDAQAQAMLEAGRRIAETVTGNPEVV